ncbi:hypothetical protein THAR02_09534 [Trichoderma harzianum]|uniref:Uncharacterized protein n=1 Tax=Trichoderma harzianum TaxID=5544 RepID=A0A0F9X0Z7_TRIHA|nr:hypothetical protein THAR02_09534 [Trichoderma harzianum]
MSSSFPWGIDGLDKSRFEAYAKLLRLKNGGQIEEASNLSEILDEDIELEKPDDTDSVNANAFLSFDERKMKRAFLDRLSELIANEKGGHHVSSSLMIEWPDRVDILVARNNGFREGDVTLRMLENIASSLQDISTLDSSGLACSCLSACGELIAVRLDPVAASTKQNLWTSLVQSYRPRLSNYMIQAKRALKETIPPEGGLIETLPLDDRAASLLLCLKGFHALIDVAARSQTQDDLEEIVKSAHNIFSFYKEHDFDKITSNNTNIRSLRDALGLLGKLQTCFNTLTRSAERLSGFQNLRILPVINLPTGAAKPKGTDRNNAWSLMETFSSLGLALNDKTAESLVGAGKRKGSWTKNKLLQRFDKMKSSASEVHAEMQVILAATKHNCTGAAIFNYVGCSKRSCFLCSRVIQSYGSYTTRGCHGKLYDLWTVPELPWLTKDERLRLVQALKNVERAMKKSLRDKKTEGLIHAKESTIGGSSVATRRQQSDQTPYLMSLVSEYLRSQRQGMRSKAGKKEDFSSLEGLSQPSLDGAQYEANLDTLLFGQTQGRSETTIPKPEQLRGLVYLDVEAIQLNEWREKGILVSKIIEAFSRLPEQNRGGYFLWFLRNQHILDSSTPPLQLDGKDNPLQRAINAARPYLDLEDRDKEFQQLEPPSKRHCFLFYAMALDSSYPNPYWAELDIWYDFGFAVCRGEYYQSQLGALYSQLVGGNKSMRDDDQSLGVKSENYPDMPTCSFNEFWLAYRNGSLGKLFHQYGLGGQMSRYLGLQEFLSFSLKQRELRPSVWRLKHFLALDPNDPLGNLPKVEAAAHEYGFTSQLNAGTRLALRQFYEQLFEKVNPLRIHDAKNCGKLLGYAESKLGVIDDGVQHVLRQFG